MTFALAVHYLLLTLATLRLSRLLTADWAGEWLFVAPAKRWAIRRYEEAHPDSTVTDLHYMDWRGKLVSGLDCSACAGFWLGLITLSLDQTPLAGWLPYQLIIGALALNYVVHHVASKLDA